MKDVKITQTQAIEEMEFLAAGYKELTSYGNPSKANLRLKAACEMAVVALKEQRAKGEWKPTHVPFGTCFLQGFECECGRIVMQRENFCPDCGADLRSERQPEDQDEDLTDKEIQAAMQRTYLGGKEE